MNIEAVKKVLNDVIKELLAAGHSPIPKENDRNAYTRACWLLGLAQRGALRHPGHATLLSNVNFLKEVLPLLRDNQEDEQ